MRELARALAYAMRKRYKRDAFIEYVDDYDDDTWGVLSRTREGRLMYALYRLCGRA